MELLNEKHPSFTNNLQPFYTSDNVYNEEYKCIDILMLTQ